MSVKTSEVLERMGKLNSVTFNNSDDEYAGQFGITNGSTVFLDPPENAREGDLVLHTMMPSDVLWLATLNAGEGLNVVGIVRGCLHDFGESKAATVVAEAITELLNNPNTPAEIAQALQIGLNDHFNNLPADKANALDDIEDEFGGASFEYNLALVRTGLNVEVTE